VIEFMVEARDFSCRQSIQGDPGVHPASYLMGTRGCFHRGEATEV
jgi:hypothetical protein